MSSQVRCSWCGDDPLYITYHDEEWGVPVHDDAKLFEFIILEWAQAGLSWITVLRKRENYRKLFYDWDIARIADMSDDILEAILLDPWVIRNRLKIYSVRENAKVAIDIQKEFGSLDYYFWKYGNFVQEIYTWTHGVLTESETSRALSKDLKKRWMSFIGSTIVYAFMQAIGMVDDHRDDCFRKNTHS